MALITIPPPLAVALAFRDGLLKLLSELLTRLESINLSDPGQILNQIINNRRFLGGPPPIPSLADLGLLGEALLDHNQQQVFALGLSDLASEAAPRPIGWRLFAGNNQGKTVLGHVIPTSAAGWKLTGCFYRDRVWDILQASLALGSLPVVHQADYELRLLTIPGLNLEAFWLVAKQPGQSDLVVPFPAAPNQPISGLNTSGAFTMADFRSIAGALAKQRTSRPPSHVS
jgi:hypothetical protein